MDNTGGRGKLCEDGLEDIMKHLFPTNYEYKVLDHNVTEYTDQNVSCEIELRVNVSSKDNVKKFLSDFNTSTSCSFNMQSGRQDKHPKGDNARSQFRGYRKCCLNVLHREGKENRQPGKNTDCKASINFRLENPVAVSKVVKADKSNFPLWVKVDFQHNHSINRAEYYKYLDVSSDTKIVYTDLFTQGFTPSSAHTERRRQIKAEYPDTWPEVCADRSVLPSVCWVYYWYRTWLDHTVGSKDGIDAYIKAEEMVSEFDSSCKAEFPLDEGEHYAKIAQSEAGETAIAIVDPFMRRVHETVPQSGELVLVDATSNLDRNDSKLFHLVCPSVFLGSKWLP